MQAAGVVLSKSARFLFTVIVSLFLFYPAAVFAVGLMDVYTMAKDSDPVFQRALLEKMAVSERKDQAVAAFLPVFDFNAGYTKTYQDIQSVNNDVVAEGNVDYGTTTFGLTLEQPVFRRDAWVGLAKSEAEILQAETKFTAAEQALIIRVAERYFAALEALDQRNLVAAEKAAIDKHYELASGRYDMGLVPIIDLHEAKARQAAVLAKTIEAENILDDAMQGLEEITGQPFSEIRALVADFDLVRPQPDDLDAWMKAANETNPGIIQQQYAVDVANLEIKKQRAAHYPTLDLVGTFESEDSDGSIYGGGTEGEVTDLMVLFNLPLYQGGAVSSKVREAKVLLSSSRQDLIRVERAVTRQTRAAFLGVNGALGRLEALKQSVISNQLALESKQDGFMSGLYTSLNVLDAERDLSLANIDYAEARYEYILNNLKLKQAVGSLQEEDLVQLEQLLEQL